MKIFANTPGMQLPFPTNEKQKKYFTKKILLKYYKINQYFLKISFYLQMNTDNCLFLHYTYLT